MRIAGKAPGGKGSDLVKEFPQFLLAAG